MCLGFQGLTPRWQRGRHPENQSGLGVHSGSCSRIPALTVVMGRQVFTFYTTSSTIEQLASLFVGALRARRRDRFCQDAERCGSDRGQAGPNRNSTI